VIVSYDSGIDAVWDEPGAADPADQGWTLTRIDNAYSDGYDSGDGGWRTVDGTTMGPADYNKPIDAAGQSALTTAPAWEMRWTVALDRDAITAGGASVSDYFLAPNNERQNNILVLLDLAADGIGFHISHKVDASNILLLEDSSGGSGTYSTGIDISNFPDFGSFSISYDNLTGSATLDYGAGTANINPGSPLVGGRNVAYFGAGTASGQGSAVWNSFEIEAIPEPGTMSMLALVAIIYLAKRKLTLM